MKSKKSIYEPIIRYLEKAVEKGINDRLERFCVSGIVACIIVLIIISMIEFTSPMSTYVVLYIFHIFIMTFLSPKEK